jgi:hypothetical protein
MEVISLILLLIFVLILVLVIWIIFVPIYLKINTQNNIYLISQRGTFRLSFFPFQKPYLSVEVFGIELPDAIMSKKEPDRISKRKPFVRRSLPSWLFLIKGLINSFRIIKLSGTADLDDVVLHSQLYAFYPFINNGPIHLTSNLNNYYNLELIIEARLSKMLYTFIIFLTKK